MLGKCFQSYTSDLLMCINLFCGFKALTHVLVFLLIVLNNILQVRGVRPMPLLEMANLFNMYHLMVCPALVSS